MRKDNKKIQTRLILISTIILSNIFAVLMLINVEYIFQIQKLVSGQKASIFPFIYYSLSWGIIYITSIIFSTIPNMVGTITIIFLVHKQIKKGSHLRQIIAGGIGIILGITFILLELLFGLKNEMLLEILIIIDYCIIYIVFEKIIANILGRIEDNRIGKIYSQ